jgi:hypothetical protein
MGDRMLKFCTYEAGGELVLCKPKLVERVKLPRYRGLYGVN